MTKYKTSGHTLTPKNHRNINILTYPMHYLDTFYITLAPTTCKLLKCHVYLCFSVSMGVMFIPQFFPHFIEDVIGCFR